MALPTPPKYKRFSEERSSKHVAREQAKKAEAQARAERIMREWEAQRARDIAEANSRAARAQMNRQYSETAPNHNTVRIVDARAGGTGEEWFW
jgi:hypothetical protein